MAATDRPTPKQTKLLRKLAEERGQTFAYPRTRGEASREIARLIGSKRSAFPGQLELDWAREGEDSLVYATAVHESELAGFGGSAHWRRNGSP
jgi:hypothetical protein